MRTHHLHAGRIGALTVALWALCAVGCGTDPVSDNQEPIITDAGFASTDATAGPASDASAAPHDAGHHDALADQGDDPVADVAPPTPDVAPPTPDAPPVVDPTPDVEAVEDVAPAPEVTPDVAPVEDSAPVEEDVPAPAPVPYDPCAVANLEVDTDGDGLGDCEELTDALEGTDPTRFNGLTATVGIAPEGFFSSAQCGLFFGTDYGELEQHFGPSEQSMSIRSGWEYAAGNTADYADSDNFDFEPNWSNSDQVGVWDSFQLLFTGWVLLDVAGDYCFSIDTGAGGIGPGDIAGRRNNCGLLYTGTEPDSGPLLPASEPVVETGYGSNESPHVACAEYAAGWHRLAIATRHYETYFYSPKLKVRWCQGEGCEPSASLAQTQLWSDAEPVPLPEMETSPVDPIDDAGTTTEDTWEGTPDVETTPEVGPTDPVGACTNPEDSAIIEAQGPEGLEAGITDCGLPCFFDGDKAQCITDCVVDGLGLTPECAACYAAPAACAMAECASPCIDGGDDCIQCMVDAGCQDDFEACSGFPPE